MGQYYMHLSAAEREESRKQAIDKIGAEVEFVQAPDFPEFIDILRRVEI